MRIAVCLSHFHPTVGGAERQLLSLCRHWTALGHQCLVFTRNLPEIGAHETIDGVRIERCVRTVNVGALFGATFVLSMAAALWRRRRDWDIALAGQGPWEAVATGLVCPTIGKPSVVRIANTGPFGDLQQLRRAKGSPALRKLFCRNNRFVAMSSLAREELLGCGCDPRNIVDCTNGVDVTQFRTPPTEEHDSQRQRTVLFVGRLAEQKDPATLLEAWKQVNHTGDYRLLVVGSGPLEEALRQQCDRQSILGVEFLGSQDRMAEIYSQASVFVLPSLSEGCSNALLEAMASGLCPLVSDIPGNRDVVTDGLNGVLFPASDANRLAEVLRKVLSDPVQSQQLAVAARESVAERHSIDQVATQYLRLFEETLSQTG